jgi:16S rRNA (guanine527-N7)-methyltransferase
MNPQDGLKRLLLEFTVDPASIPGLKLQTYLRLLEKWNSRVNLTSSTSWEALEPLFREGVWAAAKYPSAPLKNGGAHLDIGSGAGFPALILHIFHPEMRLELVESRGKKGAFLETAAWELDLPETQVHTRRLAGFLATCPPDKVWDCVSWKAIKLAGRDLLELGKHAGENSRFWMFHGREAAVENAEALASGFVCDEKTPVPGQKESFLSIYRPEKPLFHVKHPHES